MEEQHHSVSLSLNGNCCPIEEVLVKLTLPNRFHNYSSSFNIQSLSTVISINTIQSDYSNPVVVASTINNFVRIAPFRCHSNNIQTHIRKIRNAM
jgi:hypothetical protein